MDKAPASMLSHCAMTRGGTKGLIVVCALCGLASWGLWTFILAREAGQDWMVFYTAARAWFDGEVGRVFDGHWMTGTINQRYADWLSSPLNYHPWLYPPHFLLLLLPFGVLSFGMSYGLFLALTFLLLVLVLTYVPKLTGSPLFVAAALLLFPQTAFIAFTGQNSFLTAALLIAGIGLLEQRPVLAGLILGVSTYKPQLFLLVPVALLAGRHWKTIAAGVASAAALAAASVAAVGPALWQQWFETMVTSGEAYQEWVMAARRSGQSVSGCLLVLGSPPSVTDLAQGVATLATAFGVWWAFRQPMASDLRLILFLAAAVLAAPHLSCQDAILLAAAALLLLRRIGETGPYRGEIALIGAIWIAELFAPPSIFKIGLIAPIVTALFIAAVSRRARAGG